MSHLWLARCPIFNLLLYTASKGIFLKWKSNLTTDLLSTFQRSPTLRCLVLNANRIRPAPSGPFLLPNLTFPLCNVLHGSLRAKSLSFANMPISLHLVILRPRTILQFSESFSEHAQCLPPLTTPGIFLHSENWKVCCICFCSYLFHVSHAEERSVLVGGQEPSQFGSSHSQSLAHAQFVGHPWSVFAE